MATLVTTDTRQPRRSLVAHADKAWLTGLIGAGIGPSLSPALHEHEAAALGLRYLYRLIDIGQAASRFGRVVRDGR